ncbi:disintegrin and metalloproteinase domain-containing protein 1b-like [Apodemus sylvaticus]|uniref:disintegrin and metalloproteinase domain-containing protein 1b-like n=1 Tax=Apodemus sylvaticus TaxID=10129 RepID=UPI002244AA21|nr:disintegrin and metalloproteinase domain-containing protein 1b-like [Apodemus sylvaticus]
MESLKLGQIPEHLCIRLVAMLLLAIIFLPSTFCDTGSVSNSSYETVIPERVPGKGTEDPGGKVSYVLLIQGQKQLLHLKVKGHYSENNFPVYSYHNGILGQEKPLLSQDCHYEGYMEGVPGSFVSVNICSGLRGVLIKEETSYGIEPILSSKNFEHALYTMAHQPVVSCSVTPKDSPGDTSHQQRSRKPDDLPVLSDLWSHTKYVEMFVVVNQQRFQMWGSSVNETVQAVVDIIALANSFTRGINTEVVLVGLEIWTEGDPIEVPVDLQATLRNFNFWRQEKLVGRVRHDVAHLIVGHRPGESEGQAFLDGACSGGFAAAVEAFHHEDVLLFAALMAHELGHNLGIQHDHPTCSCGPKHFCLMHEKIKKDSGFSNCSSDHFLRFLHGHRGACLLDEPWRQSRKRRAAHCGNGVVEDPEECDCGSDCDKSHCCDENCKLKGGSQCSDELCCFQCKFKKKGDICRPADGPCDLEEYCNGTSANCPRNRIAQDGSVCHESFFCFDGHCMDPSFQCSRVFGNGAKSGPDYCYSSLNSRGDRFGNCGVSSELPRTYTKCSDHDVMCGKLVCTEVAFLPQIKPNHMLIQVPQVEDWCWTLNTVDQTDTIEEGNVRDNTFCGKDKVCENSVCKSFTLPEQPCNPSRHCNEHGVCNDLGNCHCSIGFAPPDCKDEGTGGSVDSGPTVTPQDDYPTEQNSTQSRTKDLILNLKLIVLTIVLVLMILLIIVCIITTYTKSEPVSEAESSVLEKLPEEEEEVEEEVEVPPEEAEKEEGEEEELGEKEEETEEVNVEEENVEEEEAENQDKEEEEEEEGEE